MAAILASITLLLSVYRLVFRLELAVVAAEITFIGVYSVVEIVVSTEHLSATRVAVGKTPGIAW